jgi:hypothetical protein
MKTIWKYEFTISDRIIIEMPKEAEILSVQMQHNKPCLWVLVDPNIEKEKRYFELSGTGHPVDMNIERWFIGTFQMADGDLVFHLWGIIK